MYPGSEATRDVTFAAQCIDEKLNPMDMLVTCKTSSDCKDPAGMFNGGCCGTSSVTRGNVDVLDAKTRRFFDLTA